ncbi:CDP-alcohol phosphatidyltransferase-domain-containing protein [Radiomyces spectabilis]|uniref:CDP-alcohol phosphatidyltransferase-domain-containing protein n=1 Tax=Radiomyces spectabilis TaxID=64574 RepID=UPI00221E382D|nr:CDP-alcohol phosphatidyltransferase-domain-containing protein [Radiomyces spectabilis]KAI8393606.1 CDP-alcohol phosphatidyltransferase-domain-containing protein [Radiomyces spectabilis]
MLLLRLPMASFAKQVPKTLILHRITPATLQRSCHFATLPKTARSVFHASKLRSRRGFDVRHVLIAPLSSGNPEPDKRNALQKKADTTKEVLNKLKQSMPIAKENIYTIPNFLTFGRLLSAPFIGYLILQHDYNFALGMFALSGLTDMLDGYIARRYNMKTFTGSIIDPAADKMLMTVMTVTLAMENVIPVPLATVILGRDVGLVLASFYYRYISLPAPKTLIRYFDFSIPSAEVRPTMISKVNTALQLLLMGFSLTSVTVGMPSAELMTGMHWLVGATTVWSGASYIYSKDAVRLLHRPKN